MITHVVLCACLLIIVGCVHPSVNFYEKASLKESAEFKKIQVPFDAGIHFVVSQGAFGHSTHNETGNEYNWDLDVPLGTNVLAIEDGVVLSTFEPNAGGGCAPKYSEVAHNIKIEHHDGTVAQYVHVKSLVKKGQRVNGGEVIAVTAMNGFLCQPHLHFGIYQSKDHLYDSASRKTIPLYFEGVQDGLLKEKGKYVAAGSPNTRPFYDYDLDGEFTKYDSNYKTKFRKYRDELKELKKELFAAQASGRDMTCSRQIFQEASAVIHNTALSHLARERLDTLRKSFNNWRAQKNARLQSSDGSWGACYKEMFWKLVESSDQIVDLDHARKQPQYPTKFLDRINSPEKLVAYLDSLLISDVAKDGVNRRRELNEAGTALVRLIYRQLPKNYSYHPKLKEALIDYLDNKWQNPETGFWGAWFQNGAKIIKTDDLSITFHIVSYRKGKVPLWGKIAQTTLAIKNRPYPLGWRHADGTMSNHHNYDVVRLLRLGWAHLPEEQRTQARPMIAHMLGWCLSESLQPDGSFKVNRSDDSLGDSYYFGVSLLFEVGYFNKAHRFWTEQEFPDADTIRIKILAKINSILNKDSMLKDAKKKLEERD
ncbi:MAG: M23 family metallopeptidase [Deltaproteobacteria bacterium]|nr:M23 family metallopeptidase [Deltaproteobacteria bacterium]